MFRQQDRDVALYQFRDQEVYNYPIPETASDTLVVAGDDLGFTPGWPRKAGCLIQVGFSIFGFTFSGHDNSLWQRSYPVEYRSASILKDFGMVECSIVNWDSQSHLISENRITAWEAVINGVKWEFWNDPRKVVAVREELPCLRETAIRALSWGVLKQQFTCPDCED